MEKWKLIKDYPNYQVSTQGRVKNIKTGSILKGGTAGTTVKYRMVVLRNKGKIKGKTIHRLVLETFKGPPEIGQEANHIDRNQLNNELNNLEWVTHKQNVLHSRSNMGRKGERHPAAKITDKQAIEIKRLRKQGVKCKEIAQQYNTPIYTILNVSSRSFKHLDSLV